MDKCPEPYVLRQMLHDERCQARLAAHTADCDQCARLVHAIMEEDIAGMRQEFHLENPALPPGTLVDLKRQILERCGQGSPATDDEITPPGQIGPYEIIQRLGSGGMGTVYQARQPHTGRIVALKLIRAEVLSDQLVRRFEREAEILAELEHPGIATVFEAGSWRYEGRDMPYLVMELVDGPRLTEYADAHGLELEQRLALMASVCDAVAYAHRHGFIHRDLKPSNILVNALGQPKVVDFGVAHDTRSDPLAAEADTVPHTRTGEIIGSSFYISPEQLHTDSRIADVRSDVYSLGVICFELLAGRLPYDFKSSSLIDVARTLSDDGPYRLSRFCTDCRGDVTTIVSKALEHDPARRYQTADQLGADIRRFLSREPIHARPVSLGKRAWLFCRRKPLVCLLVAVIWLVVLALAVGGPILAESFRMARLRAERAQQRAEQQAHVTRELLVELSQISAVELAGKEGVTELRTDILERVLGYYQELAQDDWNRSNVVDLADAHFQIGRLSYDLGKMPEAERAYNEVISILDDLAAKQETVEVLEKRARTCVNLANVQISLRHFDDALRSTAQARAQWEQLARRDPENPEYCHEASTVLLVQGLAHKGRGDRQLALIDYEECAGQLETWLSADPDDLGPRRMLSLVLRNLGNLYDDLGRYAAARQAFERAVDENICVLKAAPSEGARAELANSYAALAVALRHLGLADECVAQYSQAATIQRELARAVPGEPGYRADLSRTLHNMGYALARLDRPQEAAGLFEEAIRERRLLVTLQPNNVSWQHSLANSLLELGTIHANAGQRAQAREELAQVLAMLTTVVDAAPDALEYRRRLATAHLVMGKLLLEVEGPEGALEQYDEVQQQHDYLVTKDFSGDDKLCSAEFQRSKAQALAALGRTADALACYQEAATLWENVGEMFCLDSARDLAACIDLAPDEPSAEQFAQRALDALRRAVESGSVNMEQLEADPDLAPLRQRPGFETIRALVKEHH